LFEPVQHCRVRSSEAETDDCRNQAITLFDLGRECKGEVGHVLECSATCKMSNFDHLLEERNRVACTGAI
jgi:hypothetical protein